MRRYVTLDRRELKARLLCQCAERIRPEIRHGDPRRQCRELRERRHARRLEQQHLVAAHPGHARQVIDRLPVLLADRAEFAEVTVVAPDRLGRRAGDHVALHAFLRVAGIGADLVHADRLALARAELDVHPLRPDSLHAGDAGGVEAQLQRVSGSISRARELGVDGLVGVVAERGRLSIRSRKSAMPRHRPSANGAW